MSWSYILSEWLLPVFLKLHGETSLLLSVQ